MLFMSGSAILLLSVLAKANRKAVYRFSQVSPDVAEAKTRAILRILGDGLKAQHQPVTAAASSAQHGRMSALNPIEEVSVCREQ